MSNRLEKIKNISSREELAKLLGVKYSFLNYILYAKKMEDNYHVFEIPKKMGGTRKISAPSKKLKNIQSELAELLMETKYLIHKPNLSHGFERKKSIMTNAQKHIKKTTVLNIDLENFFDSINFGRVRGFFIKNKNFELSPEVATTIAQIACYNNALPQGSPCSPVIANLITNTLDIHLNKMAKNYGCLYSRYADDITISTNKIFFSSEIVVIQDDKVVLGSELLNEIARAGFSVNNKKVRVQFENSRQDVTGLIVNKKVNVRSEYWRTVRAMAYSLFTKGFYSIDGREEKDITILEGKLSFIDSIDKFNHLVIKSHKVKQKGENKLDYFPKFNVREKIYSKFLYYKYFHANKFPMILTEGKTDIIYLKSALDRLKLKYPQLSKGKNSDKAPLMFFKKTKKARYFLDIVDGAASLKKFVQRYQDHFKLYTAHKPISPVIMILDNDNGPNEMLGYLEKEMGISKIALKEKNFVHIWHNLYLILTPLNDGEDTAIEDLFEKYVLDECVNGKTFSRKDNYCIAKEYGKATFAKEVIQAKANSISFDGFYPIFDAITEIVEHYNEEAT